MGEESEMGDWKQGEEFWRTWERERERDNQLSLQEKEVDLKSEEVDLTSVLRLRFIRFIEYYLEKYQRPVK